MANVGEVGADKKEKRTREEERGEGNAEGATESEKDDDG